MKTQVILLALALGVSTCLITAQNNNPPNAGGPPPPRQGGPGARQPGGFHILPPRAAEQLNLTAEQQKQVAALETEVRGKLEKILTPEQMEQLRQMRPPGPGGRGPGAGGPAGGNPPPPPGQ